MIVSREEIVEALRGREEDELAERAAAELPEELDTDEEHEVLERLGINATDLLGGIAGTFG